MKISLKALLLMLLAVAGLNTGHAAEQLELTNEPSILAPAKHEAAAPQVAAWPHADSDLEHDDSVVYGQLENGLRYAIMPTKSQPGRASLRMHMDVGSLNERNDELGIAHFLEHMAFNGMRRFPAGQTIENFQRMGMSFGAHNNAETSFNSTTYIMNLPRAGVEETGEVLKYFRDVLDGMNLDAKEINKERGVILREMSTRDTAELRIYRATLEYVLPETLYPRRLPIGTIESISKMPRERFVEFYNAWYRPERATVIAVGDFKVEDIRRLIEREFSDATAHGAARANPDLGQVTTGLGVTAKWVTTRDSSSTIVTINNYKPASKHLDTRVQQKEQLVQILSHLMLNRRLGKLTELPGAVLSEAKSAQDLIGHNFKEVTVQAKCEADKCQEAVVILENEIRRAVKHGFTKSEFAGVKELMLKGLNRIASQAESRSTTELAGDFVESLVKNEVFMSPAQGVKLVDQLFEEIDAGHCTESFRADWNNDDIRILVSSDKEPEAKIADKLVSTYKLSQWVPVSAPQDVAADVWAYTDFGIAGKVVERKALADLGVLQVKFANNVRVNIKRTAFDKNEVNVALSFGGGLLDAPADKPGLVQFTKGNFISGGLKKHTTEELNRAVSQHNVRIRFAIDEDSFLLGGRCTTTDLETQLQICMAYLTEPAFRPEVAEQFQKTADSEFSQLDHTIEGICARKVASFFRGGDIRFGTPDRESLRARTVEEAKAWLAKPLSEGYLEVTIVGDIDPDQAVELAAKTLGALPEREAVKPDYAQSRVVHFPKTPQIQNFSFTAETLRAMVVVAWPTADGRDFARSCQLGVLAQVLNDRVRLKVREELGAAYTPNVYNFESTAMTGFGIIGADLIVDAKQVTEIGKLVTEIAADLRDGAISDDEFDRAVKPMRGNVDAAVLNNGYWMNILSLSQSRPAALDEARQLAEIYRKTTKEDIQALAKAYLAADRAAIVTLTPEKTGESVSSVPGKEAAR